MTYDREHLQRNTCRPLASAVASHMAELVRGDFFRAQGPLIRPSATFSPGGEGT